MPDTHYIYGSGSEKTFMMDGFGNRRQIENDVLISDIKASERYKHWARKHNENWFPAVTVSGNTLTLSESQMLKKISFLGFEVFLVGTSTPGTTKVTIQDDFGTVYFTAGLVQGVNHFDFPEGIDFVKPDVETIENYGDFSIVVSGAGAGTNIITLHGWRP